MRTFLRRSLEAAVLTGGFVLLGVGVANADTGVSAPTSVPSSGGPGAAGSSGAVAGVGGGPLGFGAVPTGSIPSAVAGVSTALNAAPVVDRAGPPVTAGPGQLPFTGVDLSLRIVTALLALVAGTALAASTRRRRTG